MTAIVEERTPDALRVEFRCPEPGYSAAQVRHQGPLFAVLMVAPGDLAAPGNCIEIACQRCKQRLARDGRAASRVIHRYTLAGDLVETLTEGCAAV